MGSKSSKTANKNTKNNNDDLKKATSKGQKAKPKTNPKKKLDKSGVKTLKPSIDKPVTPKVETNPLERANTVSIVENTSDQHREETLPKQKETEKKTVPMAVEKDLIEPTNYIRNENVEPIVQDEPEITNYQNEIENENENNFDFQDNNSEIVDYEEKESHIEIPKFDITIKNEKTSKELINEERKKAKKFLLSPRDSYTHIIFIE